MKKIILLSILVIGFNSYSQELTCKDFKNGTFIVPKDEMIPTSFKIIRNGNSQIEFVMNPDEVDEPELKEKAYEIIEWIDDCTYKLKYDESKMKLTESKQFINDNGGIMTEMIKIEGKCFYYKSTLTVNGQTQRIDGKICTE